MFDQSSNQLYVSSSIFGICILIFLIKLSKGNQKNSNFLNSSLNGKFHEDCNIQIEKLNSFETALVAQNFQKIIKINKQLDYREAKAKAKATYAINSKRSFSESSFKILLITIFSGGIVLTVLNFAILIIAEKVFVSHVDEVPMLLNDIFYAGALLKKTQVTLAAFTAYTWKRDSFIVNKHSEAAFDDEIKVYRSDLQKISEEFSFDFHLKMKTNFCDSTQFDPAYQTCNTTLNGINTRGIEVFMNFFLTEIQTLKSSVAQYPFLHPSAILIGTDNHTRDIFEASSYYFTPAMTTLINQTSDEILEILDEGSTPVVAFIFVGMIITLLFFLYMSVVIYPRLIIFRRDMCHVLLMFNLKSILMGRGLMEILLTESKEFYGLLKRASQTGDEGNLD
jgi:hypothetical protein